MEFKKFHTLMNERNDMLHGNICIKKLSYGDVYFNQDMAIYDTYQDHWKKSIGVLIQSVKFESLHQDLIKVENFIEYILSKLSADISGSLKSLLDKTYLGYNEQTGRMGILFSDHFADFGVQDKNE